MFDPHWATRSAKAITMEGSAMTTQSPEERRGMTPEERRKLVDSITADVMRRIDQTSGIEAAARATFHCSGTFDCTTVFTCTQNFSAIVEEAPTS